MLFSNNSKISSSEKYSFNLIDTGGIDLEIKDFNQSIKIQAELAMEESDVIVFVVDGREDLTSNDLYIRDMLMKTNKKVIVALNKLDNNTVKYKRCLLTRLYKKI